MTRDELADRITGSIPLDSDKIEFLCPLCGADALTVVARAQATFTCSAGCNEAGIIASMPGLQAYLAGDRRLRPPPGNHQEFTLEESVEPQPPISDTLLRRVPPQNVEAEMGILAGILCDSSLLPDVAKVISAEDFYRESHRKIFEAMQRCAEAGRLRFEHEPGDELRSGGVDVIGLKDELRVAGVLEAVGGVGYLAELALSVVGAFNVPRWCELVREAAVKREIITQGTQLVAAAYNGAPLSELALKAREIGPGAILRQALAPALIQGEVEMMSGKTFAAKQAAITRQWLIDGLLARQEISLWSGKVEAGKTTLMRTLVMAVARGENFLDRWASQSPVLYVMLDGDGASLTYEEFLCLGWSPGIDPIYFIVDPVMAVRPNSFEQFHATLLDLRPGLVVIDPLGRFQKVEDFLSYDMTYAMARFSELARQADCHIALLHHIPRGRHDSDDPATAAFGSVAIAGACNARFVCLHKPGDIYTVVSSKGKGGGFRPFDGEIALSRDETTHWVSARGPYSWKEQADAIKPRVLEAIEATDDDLSAVQIGQVVGVQRSIAGAAAKSLYKDGKVDMKVTKANKHLFTKKSGQIALSS